MAYSWPSSPMEAARTLEVLVIDPDPSIRALLRAVLERGAAHVTCAGDREAALACSRTRAFAAVILEPHMRDGDLLLRELCASPPTRRPKIIVATTDAASIERFRHDGVDVVLTKPFAVEEVVGAVGD